MIRHLAAFLLVGLSAAVRAGDAPSPVDNAADTIRADCRYDIASTARSRFSSVIVEAGSGAYKTYTATFQLAGLGKMLTGRMRFDCLVPTGATPHAAKPALVPSTDQAASEPVLSPKALIENEDAGGRYARTVVWQRPLPSTRWSADVAYVNAVLGDGQRSRVNVFLVCSRTDAIPCVEVTLDQHAPLSNAQQQGMLDFLGQIAPSTN